MPDAWSHTEVAATVSDYLAMLDSQLRGEPYNKREHNRHLQQQLNNRSAGAIEFKHCNISAVLIEMGIPPIDGYKPRSNYQQLLINEVDVQIARRPQILVLARSIADATVDHEMIVRSFRDVVVDAPVRQRERFSIYEGPAPPIVPRPHVNYLERESRNASLGRAGELYRLFKCGDAPKLFILNGPLRETCNLDPIQFRASVL